MLTVRHEEPNGHESVNEAIRVWRDPHPPQCCEPQHPLYAEVPGDAHPLAFTTGRVFVMNTAGKTVATYVFDWPPEIKVQ